MLKLLKKLSLPAVTTAILFLLVQVFCNLYLPYLTAGVVNKGIMKGDLSFIWSQGKLMLVMTVISLVAALLNTYVASKVAYGFGKELRETVFTKVLSFSKKEYDHFGPASLITRNITDVSQVQELVSMLLKFLILAPLYLVGGIGLTYLLSPQLSFVFVAVLPVLTIAAIVVQKSASPLYSQMQQLVDRLNLIFREGLTGIKIIRSFNNEEKETAKYTEVNQEYLSRSIKAGTIMSVFIPLISLLMNLTILAVIWLGSQFISVGSMEIGTVIAVMNYSTQILMGFGILTSVILAIPKGQTSAKRINEILQMPLSVEEMTNNQRATENRDLTLTFENVNFSYPGATKSVLENLSFSINSGQTLAIIGGTGEGKSTLLNLLARMYDVQKGAIKLNSQDIRSYGKEKLNNKISMTSQQAHLFFGTIRSNMLLARADATDSEIWHALELAKIADFVRESPLGLETVVEKAGGNFSGGQRQRLCIARTLLKKAELYVFDDSFSALDFKTDRQIRQQLHYELAEKIIIMVAQRINTIVEADVIVVLNQGKVVGIGNHKQLLATNEVYQEIYYSQMEEREVA